MYKRQISGIGGGGNNNTTFAFWERIFVPAAVCFGFFGGVLYVFLMYSCSKSFRELESAIKNYSGGLGAKLSF